MSQRIKLDYSVYRLANELGIERDTLERRANRNGIDLKNLFLRDVVTLMVGDKNAATNKKLETETTLNEIEIAEKQQKLVDRAQVESELWDGLSDFKSALQKLAKKHRLEKEIDALMEEGFRKGLIYKATLDENSQ